MRVLNQTFSAFGICRKRWNFLVRSCIVYLYLRFAPLYTFRACPSRRRSRSSKEFQNRIENAHDMEKITRRHNFPREDIYSKLLDVIRAYAATSDRLPPEEVLATDMGISRVKLRDVLAALETNGYINRKKGVGTIINRHLLEEPARLDVDSIYEEVITKSGFKARTLIRKLQLFESTPEYIAGKLMVSPDEPIHLIEKVVFADDKPAIFLQDYVPPKYYNQNNIDMRLLASSTFCFIQEYCSEILENIVVHLDACEVDDVLAGELNLREGSPILRLDAVCYSLKNTPLAYSIEYHNTKLLPYCIHKRLRRTRYFSPKLNK